jgi:hypothetical protein
VLRVRRGDVEHVDLVVLDDGAVGTMRPTDLVGGGEGLGTLG